MSELFQQVLSWVAQHPYWAGLIIFLVSMAESLAIVGVVVPGVVIMFGIGALIAAGSIDFWVAMAWAVAGAIVGDGISFWVGYHFRERLTTIWPFSRHPGGLARGVEFFQKYGGKSVAVGRFFGPVRAVIPLVAGMLGMSPWRFVLANVVSALAWAPAYLVPGMVFGASLELAAEVAFRLVILLLLLAGSIWLVSWLIHRVFLLLQPYTTRMVRGILRWGDRHPYWRGIAAALADPRHPEARGLSILATLLVFASALFTLIVGWGLHSGETSSVNYLVHEGLQTLRTPWTDHLFVFVSSLADLETIAALWISIGLLLLGRGRRHTLVYWMAAAGFAVLAGPLLVYLQPPRPDLLSAQDTAISTLFGDHTLWATVIYGFASVMIARSMPPPRRWIPYTVAGLLIGGIAFSRLYLGVNWLSDVLGSFTLGLIWISALGIAYSRHTEPESNLWPLTSTAALAVTAMLAIHGLLLHATRFETYQPPVHTQAMESRDWWETGWSRLPAERLDTMNRQDHRLTIQYAGPLPVIRSVLERAGWRLASQAKWENLLKLLSPGLDLQQLPVLPQIHDGAHEVMLLEKPLPGDRRLVFRLWSANTTLRPQGLPLWVGLVSEQRKVDVLGLITFGATLVTDPLPLAELIADLGKPLEHRLTKPRQVLLLLAGEMNPKE
ncbi:MAG: VTT domain-containing protein [Gammaproteobacteria bacterium]|nr:VTT domain-containing protein [Gammaproteobacteria bacterium]